MLHRHASYQNAKIKGIPAAMRIVSRGNIQKPPDVVRPSAPVASIIFSSSGIIVGTVEGAPLGAPLGTSDGDCDGTGIRELNLSRVIGF
jgi:hypothetical protein